MSAVLTIVGSSARAAAQSAARSGLVAYAADSFADTDLRQVATATKIDDYPAELEATVAGPQPGSWIYTGALENHPELVRHWERLRPLLGNPADVLQQVRNPRRLARALRNAGLASPAVSSDARQLPRNGTWLAKPLRSAGGARIARLNESWLEPADPREFYFQERIEGTPVAAIYLANARGVVSIGVTEQLRGSVWGGDSEFRYCGSIGPRRLPPRLAGQFQQIGETLRQAFGLVGLFGVDAIQRDDTVFPVEVNPRYTASVEVLERATGFEAVFAHMAVCQDAPLPTAPTPGRQAGKLIVWATQRCAFPTVGEPSTELHSADPMPTIADIPEPNAVIDAGWPIATVLADAENAESVALLLRSRATALRARCRAC